MNIINKISLILLELLFVGLLFITTSLVYADSSTTCQQMGNYIECNTKDSDDNKVANTTCLKQGNYTDCDSTEDNLANVY